MALRVAARTAFARLPVSSRVAVASARPALIALRTTADVADAASSKTYGAKITSIVDEVEKLTILEVADLVDALKTRLNISDMPIAAVGAAPAAAAPAEAAAEEKTEFDVKLTKFDEKAKIKVIKEVRNILPDLKLAEAKKLVEELPQVIKTGINKDDANKIKELLEAAGGHVEVA